MELSPMPILKRTRNLSLPKPVEEAEDENGSFRTVPNADRLAIQFSDNA